MQIICPHCTTSYDVNPANFGEAGRKVRCARCQEVWQAHPEPVPAMADAEPDNRFSTPEGKAAAAYLTGESDAPHVESPSISGDWPDPRESHAANDSNPNWATEAQQDEIIDHEETPRPSRFHSLGRPIAPLGKLKWPASLPAFNLKTACAAMTAMVLALIVWRSDVVRAMPQTATFFNMVGMGVNLRGLSIEDVKITTEIANNKPVLLIEGNIRDVARKPVEIPRLRFIVRDEKGADLYAWNAVLEQPSLIPGEKAWFKTRLAAPPPEGREIAVRFFHKTDLATGGT
ncbi:MAG: zinc-ribbon domain-containing protein [Rhizobiales bacterium]|nr:zinc-ribbon domain-containing protein [Hyphomicrobiales bacterium]